MMPKLDPAFSQIFLYPAACRMIGEIGRPSRPVAHRHGALRLGRYRRLAGTKLEADDRTSRLRDAFARGAGAAGRDPALMPKLVEHPTNDVAATWPRRHSTQAHVEVVSRLFDSGATHVFVHSGQPDQRKLIDFYGEKALQQLHR